MQAKTRLIFILVGLMFLFIGIPGIGKGKQIINGKVLEVSRVVEEKEAEILHVKLTSAKGAKQVVLICVANCSPLPATRFNIEDLKVGNSIRVTGRSSRKGSINAVNVESANGLSLLKGSIKRIYPEKKAVDGSIFQRLIVKEDLSEGKSRNREVRICIKNCKKESGITSFNPNDIVPNRPLLFSGRSFEAGKFNAILVSNKNYSSTKKVEPLATPAEGQNSPTPPISSAETSLFPYCFEGQTVFVPNQPDDLTAIFDHFAVPAGLCEGGACSTETILIENGRICGGECKDVSIDPQHCGYCNQACGSSELCEAKACICDPNLGTGKSGPGQCGCATPDDDNDGDGTANCNDGCPDDAAKTSPGACGCGVGDADSDCDGTADCSDGCPNNPDKSEPAECGCDSVELVDPQGVTECKPQLRFGCPVSDSCSNDPNKTEPGICGCGVAETDSDGDGIPDCNDPCLLGTWEPEEDNDGDSTPNCVDPCPDDSSKVDPGLCGCGNWDGDTDGDGAMDCQDGCPNDAAKKDQGQCGCGNSEDDEDKDGTADCNDQCLTDPNKSIPGDCDCGYAEIENCNGDDDGDGVPKKSDPDDNDPNVPACTDPAGCGSSSSSASSDDSSSSSSSDDSSSSEDSSSSSDSSSSESSSSEDSSSSSSEDSSSGSSEPIGCGDAPGHACGSGTCPGNQQCSYWFQIPPDEAPYCYCKVACGDAEAPSCNGHCDGEEGVYCQARNGSCECAGDPPPPPCGENSSGECGGDCEDPNESCGIDWAGRCKCIPPVNRGDEGDPTCSGLCPRSEESCVTDNGTCRCEGAT